MKWTEKEINLLKKTYPYKTRNELIKLFKRTETSIITKAMKLGLKKVNRWKPEEVKKLKKLYPKKTNKELLKEFRGRDLASIKAKAGKLKIKKEKNVSRRAKLKIWNEKEIILLKKLYPIEPYYKLLKIFPTKTRRQITGTANLLGLRKLNKKHMSRTGKRCNFYGKLPKNVFSKQGKRDDIGHYVRSSYEANIARLLKLLNKDYEYEKYTFDLVTINSTYTPDFYITEDELFVEIKGYWRQRGIDKFNAFKYEYPDIKIITIEKDVYDEIGKLLKNIIPFWEYKGHYMV